MLNIIWILTVVNSQANQTDPIAAKLTMQHKTIAKIDKIIFFIIIVLKPPA